MSENELDQWVTLASHDAETARLLMVEHGYPEIIIFHMHQAIKIRRVTRYNNLTSRCWLPDSIKSSRLSDPLSDDDTIPSGIVKPPAA